VENSGAEKLTIQMRAVRWYQDENGSDKNDPTEEIIYFHGWRRSNQGRRRSSGSVTRTARGTVERTYRLYLEEIPVAKSGEAAVNIAVRMGIPIFIKPAANNPLLKIERFDLADGTLGPGSTTPGTHTSS